MVVVASIVGTWMDLMNAIVKLDYCCQVTTQRALVINWYRVSIILRYKINLNVLIWYIEPCLNPTSMTPIFVFRINRHSVKLTKIPYKKNFFVVLFIHDSCIFRVLFIHDSCILRVLFIHDSCIFRFLFIHDSCIFRILFIQDSCILRVLFIHNSCIFMVLFMHDSCIFRVLFIHDSCILEGSIYTWFLYIQGSIYT